MILNGDREDAPSKQRRANKARADTDAGLKIRRPYASSSAERATSSIGILAKTLTQLPAKPADNKPRKSNAFHSSTAAKSVPLGASSVPRTLGHELNVDSLPMNT
jgi:hypothetical protein